MVGVDDFGGIKFCSNTHSVDACLYALVQFLGLCNISCLNRAIELIAVWIFCIPNNQTIQLNANRLWNYPEAKAKRFKLWFYTFKKLA